MPSLPEANDCRQQVDQPEEVQQWNVVISRDDYVLSEKHFGDGKNRPQ